MSGRSKRSTTYDQFRDAIKELDEGASEFSLQKPIPLARHFMKYWDANDAAAALSYLRYMEIKTKLRMLQQTHGFWSPPPEVAKYLKKRPAPMTFTKPPNPKDERNLKLVLHVLGVSPQDNRPYKDFLKAKTIRQRRFWLYKYMRPMQAPFEAYREPICETRLKRLYHFFPDRFTEEDGIIYFNNKTLLYNETSKLFFLGTRPFEQCSDETDSCSDDMEVLTWRSD